MGKILVGGSIAFDNIMSFPGLFTDSILPDRLDALNVSFLVDSLKKVRGGSAPNIAYSLSLIGLKPAVLGTAGRDFYEYRDWLEKRGIDTSYIRILDNDYTATCFITTDMSNNQITGFYPGAMSKDPEITLKGIDREELSMMIIAPTDPKAMLKWASECRELRIPYVFDPGMQIPRLSGGELADGMKGARILIFNEYEYSMMLEKTGLNDKQILEDSEILVITLGERGSIIRTRDEEVFVPAARPEMVVDPTGAGDAFRAGLLKGYLEGASLEVMGQYASVTAVYAVEHKGATEHYYSVKEFYERHKANFT